LRAVIIANGNIDQTIVLKPNDILIAADGGTNHCLEQGLSPSVVIGDLDSTDPIIIERLRKSGTEVFQYPKRKDYSDLEIALQYVQDLKVNEIIVYAALGNRWDQSIANILLPIIYSSIPIRLIDKDQEFLYLNGPEKKVLNAQIGDTISLLSLTAAVDGISTTNLEYPLQKESLVLGSTRGISNVFLSDEAFISLEQGILLCVITHNTSTL
jgi:thiamine pyrophosphokinase